MERRITIMTFMYPQEMALARAYLESNGVQTFTKDELTSQVTGFYSTAIGGVKLEVWESDGVQAVNLLKQGGYLKESVHKERPGFEKIVRITNQIPVLRNLDTEKRLLLLIAIFLFLLIVPLFVVLMPK